MLTTIKGTYDHGQIILHETPSIQEGTEVLVTFLEQEPSIQEKVRRNNSTDKKGIRFGSLLEKLPFLPISTSPWMTLVSICK